MIYVILTYLFYPITHLTLHPLLLVQVSCSRSIPIRYSHFCCQQVQPDLEVPWCNILQAYLLLFWPHPSRHCIFLWAKTEFRHDVSLKLRSYIKGRVLNVKARSYVKLLHIVVSWGRSNDQQFIFLFGRGFFNQQEQSLKDIVGKPSANRRIINQPFNTIHNDASICGLVSIFKGFVDISYLFGLCLPN